MSRKAKGIVRPDFSRERGRKLDLSDMFAASMATQVTGMDGQPGTSLEGARLLPLDLVDHNPKQARQAFDVDSLKELADSVREHGVIEPVIVRPSEIHEGRYEIVAGERRYRAAMLAEQETIPARIMELDHKQAAILTALENLQREDLDIEDEARQFAYLCEALKVSQRELAKMLGKNHVYISRRIKLLKHPDLMEEYRSGRLVLLQAAALAGSTDDEGEAEEGEEGEEGDDDEAASDRNILLDADEPGDGGGQGEQGEQSELQLVEREDMPGFVVKRGSADASSGSGSERRSSISGGQGSRRPMFRWRPLMQFHNWVGRTRAADIPEDERVTVRAQLTEIKEALEKQLAELDQIGKSRTAPPAPLTLPTQAAALTREEESSAEADEGTKAPAWEGRQR